MLGHFDSCEAKISKCIIFGILIANAFKELRTKDLNKSLTYESLLGELSAELVNLSLESMDTTIESSIKN